MLATQDIAVDAWSVQQISKEVLVWIVDEFRGLTRFYSLQRIAWASAAQTVGMVCVSRARLTLPQSGHRQFFVVSYSVGPAQPSTLFCLHLLVLVR